LVPTPNTEALMSIEENKKIVEPRSKADIDPGAASTIMSVNLVLPINFAHGPRGVDFLAAQTGAHTPSLARLLRAPHLSAGNQNAGLLSVSFRVGVNSSNRIYPYVSH